MSRLTRLKKCIDVERIECIKALLLDVPTRWNSTYNMLEVARKYEKTFLLYDDQEPIYEEDLHFEINGNGLIGGIHIMIG